MRETLTFTEATKKIWSSPELMKVVKKLRASFSDVPRGLTGRVTISEMSRLAESKLGIKICPNSVSRLVENGTVLTYGLIFDKILGVVEKKKISKEKIEAEGKIEEKKVVSKQTRRASLVKRVSTTTELILEAMHIQSSENSSRI